MHSNGRHAAKRIDFKIIFFILLPKDFPNAFQTNLNRLKAHKFSSFRTLHRIYIHTHGFGWEKYTIL